MADVFFSYSSKDRERVRPIHEALTALGFDVFWDQQVPAGKDWDTWIREELADARCAVVFWSLGSVASRNVRHEATIASEQEKLVPVMLDLLRVEQFPIGLFNTQAARLIEWSGDGDDPEWRKLLTEIENKLMPVWAARRIAGLDAELKAEGRRRETAQAGEDAAEAQLAQEIAKQGQLRRDRERAQADTETARAELSGIKEALDTARAQNNDVAERLASAEVHLAQEAAKQEQLRRDHERGLADAAAAQAEVAGVREALDAARAQNNDMAARLASAEKLVASARKSFPITVMAVGVVLALGVGASVAYFAQEAAWTKREARAVSEATAKAEAETRQNVEAEARERERSEAQKRERERVEAERKAAAERRDAEQRRLQPEAQERRERELREAQQGELAEKQRRVLLNVALSGPYSMPGPSVRTMESCRDECIKNPNCKGFEFDRSNRCRIFSAIGGQYNEVGTTSGRWD